MLHDLSARSSALNPKSLLGDLKAHLVYFDRLSALNQITQAQQQDFTWSYADSVMELTNKELANVYQLFTSAEMDFLQSALMEEGQENRGARDARRVAGMLFDLQGIVLKEINNRSIKEQMSHLEANNPLTEADQRRAPQNLVTKHTDQHDLSAANLLTLTEVSALSATNREKNAVTEKQKLEARKLDNVTLKEMGDTLRKAELTINIETKYLKGGPNAIFNHPDDPLVNLFTLREQGIKAKSDGYMAHRESTENILFPELKGHKPQGKERPVYAALNTQGRKVGAAADSDYGNSVIVLKPEVAKRATYQINDSFMTTPLKIDEQRKQTFYALLQASDKFSQELKDVLANPESEERKEFEEFLTKLSLPNNNQVKNIDPNYFPLLKPYLHQENGARGFSDDTAYLAALMTQVFGDAEATRHNLATYDNLESLIPQLNEVDGNSLARGAMQNRQGQNPNLFLNGCPYIEAQLHGPIVPTRDIAEIRFDLDDIPEDEHTAFIAKCRRFQKDTGIKITFLNDDIKQNDSDNIETISTEQESFNKEHLDKGKVTQLKNEYLQNLQQKVNDYIIENNVNANLDFPAEYLTLDGAALNKLGQKFIEEIENVSAQNHSYNAEGLISECFSRTVSPMLKLKKQLLSAMHKFPLNEAQKQAFAKWIVSAKKIDSVEELNHIFKLTQSHERLLREIISANPPKTEQELLQLMIGFFREFDREFGPYFHKLMQQGEEVGPDDINTEYNRISFMSLAMLQFGEPPLDEAGLQNLHARLNSPQIRTLISKLDDIRDFGARAEAGARHADLEALGYVMQQFTLNAQNAAQLIKQRFSYPKSYSGDLALIPKTTRDVLRDIAPDTMNTLDAQIPAYAPISAPANPQALPQNTRQRRQFCVKMMDGYLNHEKTFERGKSTHGRGHIARSFIYAEVMSNILIRKYGIKVDKNAVLCGIAGHDSGRRQGGDDSWEQDSAELTVNAMQTQFGPESLGPDYAKDVAGCINSRSPRNNTVEAMLLKSADSLDIGRVYDFDPKFFPFLKNKNGQGQDNDDEQIRAQLAQEADLLQKLTDPVAAHRQTIEFLDDEAANAPSQQMVEYYQQQKQTLLEEIGAMLEEDWELSSEAYLQRVEKVISDNKQLFPLLSEYYQLHDDEQVQAPEQAAQEVPVN